MVYVIDFKNRILNTLLNIQNINRVLRDVVLVKLRGKTRKE